MNCMNDVRLESFKFGFQQLSDVWIVVLGARRMCGAAQVVMNLSDRDAFMLCGCCFEVIPIERWRFDMRYYAHGMPRALRANSQAVRVNFSAADAARKILMCEIGNLQLIKPEIRCLDEFDPFSIDSVD